MTKLVSTYSVKSLIQSLEFLLKLARTVDGDMDQLEKAKEDVKQQQKEAQKQGLLVKKMTTYMSEELDRIDNEDKKELKESLLAPKISKNLEKLSKTETKLAILRTRLNEFVDEDDQESLKAADASISVELKRYESFMLDLTNLLNEKIVSLEKISDRLRAEKRESQQQKLLLKEIIDLFNNEIIELGITFKELKK